MKKILASLVLVLLAAFPVAAQARSALDPSFGTKGRVVRQSPTREIGGPTQVKEAPDGTIFALYRTALMAFEPDGGVDASFGKNGVVMLPQIVPFQWNARLEVDSLGRLVIAGTTDKETSDTAIVPTQGVLAVARLLPNGALDPSFNGGEVLITDLGLPEATPPPEAPDSVKGGVSIAMKSVGVDAANRILVSGNRVASYAATKNGLVSFDEGLAARFAEDGSLDRGYGDSGVARGFAPQGVSEAAFAADGSLFALCFESSTGAMTTGQLVRLTPEGRVDSGFGGDGSRPIRYSEAALALDDRGRLIVSAWIPGNRAILLTKLRRDGRLAGGFGRAGKLRVGFSRSVEVPPLIAADSAGGLFLASTWSGAKKRGGEARAGFFLAHLTPRGRLDRGFGLNSTGFGAGTKATLQSLTVDRDGRPLLAGNIHSRMLTDRLGLAIARYKAP